MKATGITVTRPTTVLYCTVQQQSKRHSNTFSTCDHVCVFICDFAWFHSSRRGASLCIYGYVSKQYQSCILYTRSPRRWEVGGGLTLPPAGPAEPERHASVPPRESERARAGVQVAGRQAGRQAGGREGKSNSTKWADWRALARLTGFRPAQSIQSIPHPTLDSFLPRFCLADRLTPTQTDPNPQQRSVDPCRLSVRPPSVVSTRLPASW